MNSDLISREALKKEYVLLMWKEHNPYDAIKVCDVVNQTLDFIDNAPAAEMTEEQAIDKLHETGWLPRHDKEMTERSQGEWTHKCIEENHTVIGTCSNCHERTRIGNFCRICGADMRGGAKNDK